MLYRQHESNTTAHFSQKQISDVAKKITDNRFLLKKELFNETKEFFRINMNSMPQIQKEAFEKFLQLENQPFITRLLKILFSKYTVGGSSHLYLFIKAILKTKFIG